MSPGKRYGIYLKLKVYSTKDESLKHKKINVEQEEGDGKRRRASQNGFSEAAMGEKDNLNLAIFHCVCTRIIFLFSTSAGARVAKVGNKQ